MLRQFLQQNLGVHLVLFFIFAFFCWILGSLSIQPSVMRIENVISKTLTCQTGSNLSQDTFVVFAPNKGFAYALQKIICDNAVLQKQYGEVEIRWSVNEQELIQHVGKGLADMALVKDNLMRAFATSNAHGYQIVGSYQDYSAYLISLKEKPVPTKEYLWGKRFGLLDYPSSRSGHIIPKSMLNTLGLNEENLEMIYANSHRELRELLLAGKVDLISSYWKQEDNEFFSENYITQIQNQVSGSKWYLKMQTQNTDLLCEMQQSLRTLATNMRSDYYSNLSFPPACERQANSQAGNSDE